MNARIDQAERPDAAEDILRQRLTPMRRGAPPGFTARVMARLPERPVASYAWWPSGWAWMPPALAGAAAAALLIFLGSGAGRSPAPADRITVQFVLHAPSAGQVELVGDFTGWQAGRLQLDGPDESGHWTVQLDLPEGRHEYLFLVDGQRWVTDPSAAAHRPDGFGNLNAVMNL